MRPSPFLSFAAGLALTLVLTACGESETPKAVAPPPSQVSVTTRDGGPLSISDDNLVVIPVRGSTLHRTLVFLNDKTAPLQISDAKTIFQGRRGAETITSTLVDHQIELQVKASQAVSAARARIVYFDTFNAQLQTQPFVWQRDVRPGEAQSLIWSGKVDTGRFANLLTFAVFFDEIRMADGTVWVANEREVTSQLRGLRLDPQQ